MFWKSAENLDFHKYLVFVRSAFPTFIKLDKKQQNETKLERPFGTNKDNV